MKSQITYQIINPKDVIDQKTYDGIEKVILSNKRFIGSNYEYSFSDGIMVNDEGITYKNFQDYKDGFWIILKYWETGSKEDKVIGASFIRVFPEENGKSKGEVLFFGLLCEVDYFDYTKNCEELIKVIQAYCMLTGISPLYISMREENNSKHLLTKLGCESVTLEGNQYLKLDVNKG